MDRTIDIWESLRKTFVKDEPDSSNQSRSVVSLSHRLPSNHDEATLGSSNARNESATLPYEIQNTPAFRRQLRQRLFDLYLGAATHAPPTLIQEISDTCSPGRITMTAAMDTLCIAQIATTFRDHNLMAVARTMYGKAIQLLSFKVGSICRMPLNHAHLEDVVGAIHTLIICAWFDCIGASPGVWVRHCQGLNNILRRYGCDSISSSFRRAVRNDWHVRILCISIGARRSVPVLNRARDKNKTGTSFLNDSALQVPRLLERTDMLILNAEAGTSSDADVIDLLTALGRSVLSIKQYHLRWADEMPPRFRTVSTKTFNDFKRLCGTLIDTFPSAYTFTQPQFESNFRVSFLCLIELEQAIMNIHEAYPEICTEAMFKLQLDVAKCEAGVAADGLCMLVPWAAQEKNGSFACVYSLVPLHYASEYYRRQDRKEELAWCTQVSRSLSIQYGISIDSGGRQKGDMAS